MFVVFAGNSHPFDVNMQKNEELNRTFHNQCLSEDISFDLLQLLWIVLHQRICLNLVLKCGKLRHFPHTQMFWAYEAPPASLKCDKSVFIESLCAWLCCVPEPSWLFSLVTTTDRLLRLYAFHTNFYFETQTIMVHTYIHCFSWNVYMNASKGVK